MNNKFSLNIKKNLKNVIALSVVSIFALTPSVYAKATKLVAEMNVVQGADKEMKVDMTMWYSDKKVKLESELKSNNAQLPQGMAKKSTFIFEPENESAYMINHQNKSAIKLDIQMLSKMQGGNPTSGDSQMATQFFSSPEKIKEMLKKQGGKMTGAETILGHLCDVWNTPIDIPGQQGSKAEKGIIKVWLANDLKLPIKMEMISPSKGKIMSVKPKEINSKLELAKTFFAVPEGYKVTDMTQFLQNFQNQLPKK